MLCHAFYRACKPAALLLLLQCCCTAGTRYTQYDYCIIGAGPGGLQLGHLLNKAGRHYVIFERAAIPGAFFAKYPVHRTLISVNKRFSGRDNAEFQLRHDWNSLLDNDAVAPMTSRTKARWPHADVLVQYMQDYARPQEEAGNIKYNTTVVNVVRDSSVRPPGSTLQSASTSGARGGGDLRDGFTVTTTAAAAVTPGVTATRCGVVISASGIDVPNIPASIEGIELAVGYEDLPATGDEFEGQAVALFGHGNAAFETADILNPFTNYVHMFGGRGKAEPPAIAPEVGGGGANNDEDTHTFVAWESRYVGDLRAINAAMLDSYLLNSLDAFGQGPPSDYKLVKCGSANASKICFFKKGPSVKWTLPESPGKATLVETINLGKFSPTTDPATAQFAATLERLNVRVSSDNRATADGGNGNGKGGDIVREDGRSNSDITIQLSGATVDQFVENETLKTRAFSADYKYVNDNNGDGDGNSIDGDRGVDDTLATSALYGLLSGEIDDPTEEDLIILATAVDHPLLVNRFFELATRSGRPYPLIFDKVVRCLGWTHNTQIYGQGAKPWMQHNKKYPVMSAEYESVTSPGLYFAGQLGHGKDHKRSAGGFIHGFRYTTRALFRVLETKYHAGQWPARKVFAGVEQWDGAVGFGELGCNAGDQVNEAPGGCPKETVMRTPFERMLNHAFSRVDTASGPYQMVGVLGDGIVFRCPSPAAGSADGDGPLQAKPTIEAEYLEEMPQQLFNQRYSRLPRLFWHFGFRKQRQRLQEGLSSGTYFQTAFWYHSGDCSARDGDQHAGDGTPFGDDDSGNNRADDNDQGSNSDAGYAHQPRKYTERLKEPTPPRKKEFVQMFEDHHTRWGQPNKRSRIGRWLHKKVAALRPEYIDPNLSERHWIVPERHELYEEETLRRLYADAAAADAAAADAQGGGVDATDDAESGSGSSSTNSNTGEGREEKEEVVKMDGIDNRSANTIFPSSYAQALAEAATRFHGGTDAAAAAAPVFMSSSGPPGISSSPTFVGPFAILEKAEQFEGAFVDVNFFNRGKVTGWLWVKKATGHRAAFMPTGVRLLPDTGLRVATHEFERWEARASDSATLLGQWWIDRCDGLVQDLAF